MSQGGKDDKILQSCSGCHGADETLDILFRSFVSSLLLCLLEGTCRLKKTPQQQNAKLGRVLGPRQPLESVSQGPVLCLPAPGQTMRGHVLRSLSAFNSQLTALIVALFHSPPDPEAMLGYNSKDTAVQVPPPDEAG